MFQAQKQKKKAYQDPGNCQTRAGVTDKNLQKSKKKRKHKQFVNNKKLTSNVQNPAKTRQSKKYILNDKMQKKANKLTSKQLCTTHIKNECKMQICNKQKKIQN